MIEFSYNMIIKPLKKLWSTVSYMFGDLKIEPKDVNFDELRNHLCFSINVCNNKDTKMYVKNIKISIEDSNGQVVDFKVYQYIREEVVGNINNKTYEQFSSCSVDKKDIFVAKRLLINVDSKKYIKNKDIYLEYDNHLNKHKKVKLKFE